MSSQLIGKYQVLQLLGRGGMAEVYLGFDPRLNRKVAIKVITAGLAPNERIAERFRREATVIAALRHPHIVRIFDFDFYDGLPFMVMEYLEGETLKERLTRNQGRREPFNMDEIGEVLRPVASALDYAHEVSLVHRDIKPANILYTARGEPVLADFGIAKILDETVQLSQTGSVLGTPSYLSPEQALGKPVDHRSDIYSLGVVIYEMAAGRLPFTGTSVTAVLMQHLNTPPPEPRSFNPKLPEPVQAALLKALSKDPSQRFQSAREFTQAILNERQSPPSIFREARPPEVELTVASGRAGGDPGEEAAAPAPAAETALGPALDEQAINNLPTQLTPFLGREREVEQIHARLEDAACRLLTLTGPGGVGKTRLAMKVAAGLLGEYQHGVCFLGLNAIQSSDQLLQAMAQALRLPPASAFDVKTALINLLRDKQMLLVLDGFEHLVEAGQEIAPILENAPQVKALVTSRQRLELQGEWVFAVDGLPLPGVSDADFLLNSAVQLFLQSARMVQPGFEIQQADRQVLRDIFAELEGLPLGIELAASWARALTPPQILQELRSDKAFLKTNRRNVPERQRSLQAIFESSWGLLSAQEQAAFRKLSVFKGEFEREAAQKVCGVPLPMLAAFVDKSLLRQDDRQRFSMTSAIAQFAFTKLAEEPAQQEKVQLAHAAYYLGFLRQQEDELRGAHQVEAAGKVLRRIGNVRAAWAYAVEKRKEELVLQGQDALFRFHSSRASYQEGERVFGEAANAFSPQTEKAEIREKTARLLVRLLNRYASFSLRLGKQDQAKTALDKALALARRLNESGEEAMALNSLGTYAHRIGVTVAARTRYKQSLEAYRKVNDLWGVGVALNNLGNLARRSGELGDARAYFEETLKLQGELQDLSGVGAALLNLASLADESGDLPETRRLLESSLEIFHQVNDRYGIALALNNLGQIWFSQQELAKADESYQDSLAIHREIGNLAGEAQVLYNLGASRLEQADFAAAQKHLEMALSIYQQLGDRAGEASTLGLSGLADSRAGDASQALEKIQAGLRLAAALEDELVCLGLLVQMAEVFELRQQQDWAVELYAFTAKSPAAQGRLRTRAQQRLELLREQMPAQVFALSLERGEGRELDKIMAELLAV